MSFFTILYHLTPSPSQEDTTSSGDEDENSSPQAQPETIKVTEADILINTASNALFEDLVTRYYIPLEIWYTRTIIDKVGLFLC